MGAFVSLDESGRLTDMSSIAEVMLGLVRTSAVGCLLADLLSRSDDVQRQRLALLLRGGAASEGYHTMQTRYARPDGRDMALELLISATRPQAGLRVRFFDRSDSQLPTTPAERQLSLMKHAEQVAQLGCWELRPRTGELTWSDNLYRLYGLEPGEIVPSLAYVLSQVHHDDRDRMAGAVDATIRGMRLPPTEYRLVQAGRATRRLRSTVALIKDDAGNVSAILGTVQDVTEGVRADTKIAAHVAVSNALSRWESLEVGGRRLLRELAGALQLEAGILWAPANDALVARVLWSGPSHDASALSEAAPKLHLRRGVGLAGRAWQSGEPISRSETDERSGRGRPNEASRHGLRGVLAIPALHAGEVVAVLELHAHEVVELSPGMMSSLAAIGQEFGQFLSHHRGDLDPISLTPRQLEVVRLAAQGLSGRKIAQRLCLSPTTVKSHFEQVYAKFGVSDRASAAATAMRYGVID